MRGFEADEQTPQPSLDGSLDHGGPQHRLHRCGLLPEPSHPRHAFVRFRGEPGVPEEVIIEEVDADLATARSRQGLQPIACRSRARLRRRPPCKEVAGVGSGTAKTLLDPSKVDPVIKQARPLWSNTEPPVWGEKEDLHSCPWTSRHDWYGPKGVTGDPVLKKVSGRRA